MAGGRRSMREDRRLLDFLLEQEAPLRNLTGMIIALDLIASDIDGIDGKDMPGLKAVVDGGRSRVEGICEAWRETIGRPIKADTAG